jgi:ribosome-binding factor A
MLSRFAGRPKSPPVAGAGESAYIPAMASTISQGRGPSQRQLRVGELVRRTLSDLLNRHEIHDPDLNAMSITVGEVRLSPDLRIATAYVMPLGGQNPEAAIAALARNGHALRRAVAARLTLKFAPDLRFLPDPTFDRLDNARRLFADARVQRDLEAGQDARDRGEA